ncbi:MAG: ribonuclease R [Bacteroidales bacterium]|nr:ribonuclease R [Bacteroidales bacterium]
MDNVELKDKILKLFAKNPFTLLNPTQVAAKVGAYDKAERRLVAALLMEMADAKMLIVEGRKRYKLNPKFVRDGVNPINIVVGTVDMKQSGKAYIIPEGDETEDILVEPHFTNHALHGDRVRVALFPHRKMHQPEGQVVEILQRARTRFVGRVELSKDFAFLVPDSKNMVVDIYIPLADLAGAEEGEKVVAEMTAWEANMSNPVGRVVTRLGKPGNNNVEMQAILAENDFPLDFPQAVKDEVAKVRKPSNKEFATRRDFRSVATLTIDPADAKDFDDALSVQRLPNGLWEVGVHIADVSHYVRPGSATDAEAYLRGTSIYLVDRTVPMLPERLSNDLCSLNAGEDKLCFSAVFEMDDQALVKNRWFGKTVINSNRRFNYDEAQAIIEGTAAGELSEEVMQLHRLAEVIRKRRYAEGAINFDSKEVKFELDENAKPIGVYIKESREANWLVEEFMLLANREVAESVGRPKGDKGKGNNQAKTFVYRVHDEPNPEKLNTFVEFVSKLGYKMKVNSRQALVKSYNNLFEAISGRGEEYMIDTIALRTMAKAVYSTQNIGHYGLSFPYYTHFTSPIRRYPDLMVHRLLERYLAGGSSVDADEYEQYCLHCSQMEKKAVDAERASIKYKQAEYLSDKIGQTFEALISGVSKWGIYAEIVGNKCEGMVPIGSLKGDYYMLDEDNYQVIGRRTGKQYKLGDPVRVQVKQVDMLRKTIDFVLIEEEAAKPKQESKRHDRKKQAKKTKSQDVAKEVSADAATSETRRKKPAKRTKKK